MLLIRFIENKDDFESVLFDAYKHEEDYIVLKREDSYKQNKSELFEYCELTETGGIIYPDSRLIVYTDDETMLSFAQYSKENHKYHVEILFDGICEDFIALSTIHPNLRIENNLTAMWQKGILHRDYEEYQKEIIHE